MHGHLTVKERDQIALLKHQGASQKEIAAALNRSRPTICRELARNGVAGEYHSGQAQQRAERRRRERPLQRKMERPQINADVRRGLVQKWSPEQIAGRLKQQHADAPQRHVSAQTIYTWIENDAQAQHWKSFLRRRGKRPNRRKSPPERHGSPIQDRPTIVEQRSRIGDFEGDTVLGPPGTGGLATLVDRRSRYTIVTKVKTKHADQVQRKLKQRLQELDPAQRHSITFDNGTEFARCHRLESHLGLQRYFAGPTFGRCPAVRTNVARTKTPTVYYANIFPRALTFARSLIQR